MLRREKAKAKVKRQKHLISQENHVANSKEVMERLLNRLRSLGKQVFALSPFSEHFDRWLMDVRVVLSEFESNPNISLDGQFVEERSKILSNVELELDKIRREEASAEEPIRNLSDNRIRIKRIEEEYTARTREIIGRRDSEIKRLSSNVDGLREEVNSIARMKTGIFKAISKKAKSQREAEATQRLKSAERELALAVQDFTGEQKRLRDQYKRMKQSVVEQIQAEQKEVENQQVDGSLEDRRAACEALINAVNALVERKGEITPNSEGASNDT